MIGHDDRTLHRSIEGGNNFGTRNMPRDGLLQDPCVRGLMIDESSGEHHADR